MILISSGAVGSPILRAAVWWNQRGLGVVVARMERGDDDFEGGCVGVEFDGLVRVVASLYQHGRRRGSPFGFKGSAM